MPTLVSSLSTIGGRNSRKLSNFFEFPEGREGQSGTGSGVGMGKRRRQLICSLLFKVGHFRTQKQVHQWIEMFFVTIKSFDAPPESPISA